MSLSDATWVARLYWAAFLHMYFGRRVHFRWDHKAGAWEFIG